MSIMDSVICGITRHAELLLVTEEHAGFIVDIRSNPALNKYLSPINPDINEQCNWIRAYKEREAKNTEYYFIIAANKQWFGAVRMYDFVGPSFGWGSWILKADSPHYLSIETALNIYEIGFFRMGFENAHFQVRRDNLKITSFHESFGAEQTGNDNRHIYYTFKKTTYLEKRRQYKKFFSGSYLQANPV